MIDEGFRSLLGDKNVLKLGFGYGCTTMNIPKTSWLYALSGWILEYVNYSSVKNVKNFNEGITNISNMKREKKYE